MAHLLDIDQLRTFVAISDSGSFTRAADAVHKTQSAVSMQMKRLEERVGRPVFERDGRASKLTDDGERLLDYARRIVRLNSECVASFNEADLAIITHIDRRGPSEIVRVEQLLWVTSARHGVHEETPVPLALGRPTCEWRQSATVALERAGRPF